MLLNVLMRYQPCGEGGEYESFTLDCPLFRERIVLCVSYRQCLIYLSLSDETEVVEHSKDAMYAFSYHVRILVPLHCGIRIAT